MSRDPRTILATPEVVAFRCAGHEWPRSVLTEAPIPDTWMGLLTKPSGWRRLVPSGEDPQPAREDTLVLVRYRAITVPIEVHDVSAADGHAIDAVVELLVRVAPQATEIAALNDLLLGAGELCLEELAAAADHAGASGALRTFVRQRSATELIRDDQREALLEHLRTALQKFLFSAGLSLERLGALRFSSASLARQEEQQRAAAAQVRDLEARGVVEQAALTATRRRIEGLTEILSKLKAATAGDETLRWRELLPVLTPGERGRLLENLWRLTPDHAVAEALIVVAGRDCIWLDPLALERVVRRITLPADLGGLRAAALAATTSSSTELLLGAASGIWRLCGQTGEILARYPVLNPGAVRTGFNAATVCGDRLIGTHSQLGAWSWRLDDPTDVLSLVQPAAGAPKTIRAVQAAGAGRVVLAVDDCVRAHSTSGEMLWQSAAVGAAIHDLALLGDTLFAVTTDGRVLLTDLRAPGEWTLVHRGLDAIESVQARRWDDLIELVIPAGGQGICGVCPEEGIVTRLLDSPVAVRRAWACDDLLVGLSENRDRLFVLHGSTPGRAGLEVPIARLLGYAVHDACILTRPAGSEA